MNGDRHERSLARALDAEGYAVIRAPASGAATDRRLPDLLAARQGDRPLAIEAKATNKNVAYLDPAEVRDLTWFAEQFGGIALLAARYKGDTTTYLVPVGRLETTKTDRSKCHHARVSDSSWFAFETTV